MDYEYQLRRTRTADTDPAEAGIVHRLYLPAPAHLDRAARHRHHIATRNVFAVLCRASLVGVTLGQTLLDVAERLDYYLAPKPQPQPQPPFDADAPPPLLPPSLLLQPPFAAADASAPHSAQQLPPFDGDPRAVRLLLDYIDARELADVRGWAEGAASMIVWTERAAKHAVAPADAPRLEALWREGFVHSTGLLGALQTLPEWRTISPITKALVDRASLEVQVRVTAADRRLAGFHFHDVWPVSSAGPPAARLAFDRFHRFLLEHYAARFGAWPPGDGDSDAHARVTRPLCQLLQRDFAALYWYLVDTDAVWSPAPSAAGSTAITTITTASSSSSSSSGGGGGSGSGGVRRTIVRPSQPAWRPDDESLPMTEMLRSFDERENHPPIPHPFPLVPPPTPASASIILASSAIGSAGVGGLGTSKKPKGFFPSAGQRNRAAQAAQAAAAAAAAGNPAQAANSPAATALALSESTNIEALRSSTSLNPLLEAFQAHEKSVPGHDIAPRDARKGRWIMIYAVVQTLASVAPDAPGLRWCDGVEYWLNPKLRGTPPWKPASPADDTVDERSHFRSPCWLGSGAPASAAPAELSAAPSGHATTPLAPAVVLPAGQQQHQQHQHQHQHQHQRLRARSRSRSRRQLRALHRESREHRGPVPTTATAAATLAATTTAADSHAQRRAESSGDEGDDEMDAGESPSPSPSSPPQPQSALLPTWGQRHVRADGLNLGVVRNDEAPWEM